MVELIPDYQQILTEELDKVGLKDKYWYHEEICFGHQIVSKEKKRFLMIIPYHPVVGEITSEPKIAEKQLGYNLQYKGLQIHIFESKYQDKIVQAAINLEAKLDEPVEVIL